MLYRKAFSSSWVEILEEFKNRITKGCLYTEIQVYKLTQTKQKHNKFTPKSESDNKIKIKAKEKLGKSQFHIVIWKAKKFLK